MSTPASLLESLLSLPPEKRDRFIRKLSPREAETFFYDWRVWARSKQIAPPGDWVTWLVLAGRGFGKTRVGAEWVRGDPQPAPGERIALVGATAADVRDVMVEGEAMSLTTEIATPEGWTTIGAAKVGDTVFSGDGTPTRIIAVSPVWNDRPCLRVCADGAAPIIADERHQWVTSARSERRPSASRRQSLKTTRDIASSLHERGRPDLVNHEVPMHGALVLPDACLPVPPYTLGAWLGDGDTRGHGTLTCHDRDAEIVDRIRKDGFTVIRRGGLYDWGIHKLRVLLRVAGLIGNKEIPHSYLRASFNQRLELLRGLMDTDGYVSARGQCSFDNTNERMVRDVRELLLTLGFKPGEMQVKPNVDGHKTMFRLTFTCSPGSPIPFVLHRKAARCKAGIRQAGRLIRSADKAESVPTRCIQVDHESGTFLAGRDLVVTHNSGILACCPPSCRPLYEPSKRRLTWPNGALATTYSADEPERLRGPQHHRAWVDEIASWRYPDAFDMLMFGLRLGERPRLCVTGTPKPVKIVRDLVKDPTTHVTRGSTYENRQNLAATFFSKITRKYEGTRLGRQELNAEILDDTPGALWQRSQIDADRVDVAPVMRRVVVAIDPSVTSTEDSDEAGIVACGIGEDGHGYVLRDESQRCTPDTWARIAINLYHEMRADRIVAEINQGGEMVELTVRTIDKDVAYTGVHASKGKHARAEPVSALYEQHKIHHVGSFAAMEDELTTWVPGDALSPGRLDAIVWAFTELMLGGVGEPRIRQL